MGVKLLSYSGPRKSLCGCLGPDLYIALARTTVSLLLKRVYKKCVQELFQQMLFHFYRM